MLFHSYFAISISNERYRLRHPFRERQFPDERIVIQNRAIGVCLYDIKPQHIPIERNAA